MTTRSHNQESSRDEVMSGEVTVTEGCSIIDEFVGQGTTTGGRQAPEHQAFLPSSASEGCATITVVSDQGFIPSSEEKKGAAKDGSQTSPPTGVD